MARILTEETSLTQKRKNLLQETGTLQKILRYEWMMAAFLLAVGVVWWLWKGQITLMGFGVVALIFYVAHRMRIQQNQREARIVQAGLKGEAEVTRKLAQALPNDHYIFNDLFIRASRKTAQIDHVVVTPKGLFAIETKNWRGHIEGDAEDERWTQTKAEAEAPIKVFNPIKQTKRHVTVLRQALEKAGIDWPDIFSMVVFLSPRTTFKVVAADVPVCRPDDAITYINEHKNERIYSEAEIDALIAFLMKQTK